MPCNLAVTITKTLVSAEHLLQLLTPAAVAPVVTTYLRERFSGQSLTISTTGSALLIWVDEYAIQIVGGQVTVTATSATDAHQLAEELTQVLGALADALFAAQLGALLDQFGATTQHVVVDNAGTAQMAYQFTLEL